MTIFFDYQAFKQQYGGISRYFCELIKGINDTKQYHAHLSILWSNNIHLQEYDFSIQNFPLPKGIKFLNKINLIYNCIDSKKSKYDIYHATYFDNFLIPYINSKPFVTTFHDMIYERFSHQFSDLAGDKRIILQKKKIAQQASHLIAISESTKKDMIELLEVNPEKITVIYHGSPFKQCEHSNHTDSVSYLLYVGNRSGYKNFVASLEAMAPMLKKYKINLICAGGGNFTTFEKNMIQSLLLRDLVQYRVIDDNVLKELYKGALAFIFPTLYEGFGIPVLEAFACDCPCIVSNTSSLPEVAGNAALYIDPTDSESITYAVESIILSENLRNELIERGRQQLLKFSWQRTVNETLGVYKKLI